METRIAGIPCTVQIDHCHVTQGTYSRQAETPEEYYGAREIEFTVCDRRGRPAPWLERKLTPDDTARIETEILESFESFND